MRGKDTAQIHGVGPVLDVEMDTPRLGPFQSSLFFGGRAYRVFDPGITFDGQRSDADAAGTDESRATFRVAPDLWMFRVDIGMRFHWMGW